MKRVWELRFWWLLVSCHMSVMSVLRHIIICLILIYPVLDALLRVVPLLCWISSVCRSETFTTTVCSYSLYGFLGLETQLWDGSVQCNWERYLWAVQRQRLIVLWRCGIVLLCIVVPLTRFFPFHSWRSCAHALSVVCRSRARIWLSDLEKGLGLIWNFVWPLLVLSNRTFNKNTLTILFGDVVSEM